MIRRKALKGTLIDDRKRVEEAFKDMKPVEIRFLMEYGPRYFRVILQNEDYIDVEVQEDGYVAVVP